MTQINAARLLHGKSNPTSQKTDLAIDSVRISLGTKGCACLKPGGFGRESEMKLVVSNMPGALMEGDVLLKFSEGSSGDEKKVVSIQKKVRSIYKAIGAITEKDKFVEATALNPNWMHVAMYVGDGRVVEESGGGLVWHYPDETARKYQVWRYDVEETRKRAAKIMRIWAGKPELESEDKKSSSEANQPAVGAEEIDPKKLRTRLKRKEKYGGFDWKNPLSSFLFAPQILGRSSPGLFSRLSRMKHKRGWQGTMICSEAVISAYQLADDEDQGYLKIMFSRHCKNPIDLDPHRTSPMKMQRWLMKQFLSGGGHWKYRYIIEKKGGRWLGKQIAGHQTNEQLLRDSQDFVDEAFRRRGVA